MEIIAAFSQYRFLPAGFFSYDAADDIINYDPVRVKTTTGKVSLLHEISHCKLGHFHYQTDLELLMMEVAAWHYTRVLASEQGIKLNEAYIQDCIDSYDTWIEKRGCCPLCDNFCIEQEQNNQYQCFVCNTRWQVSSEPQQRIMRRKIIDRPN